MNPIQMFLASEDRVTTAGAEESTRFLLDNPEAFPMLIDLLDSGPPSQQAKAARVLEMVTKKEPAFIQGRFNWLHSKLRNSPTWEVRHQACRVITRIDDLDSQIPGLSDTLFYLQDDVSKIVRTSAMQALADLSLRYEELMDRVYPLVLKQTEQGSAAQRARGRKLLKSMDRAIAKSKAK